MGKTSNRFKVNLTGIISLLSNHLYSGPEVFVREILQNAVDGIRAREVLAGQDFSPSISIVIENPGGQLPTLVLTDSGVGLTEEEVHQFLATIGESSKRDELGKARQDFIGQFGIGLLSCFLVADEIVLITQSVKTGARPVEWIGRPDGTYTVRQLERKLEAGTRVYLRCKEGMQELFEPARVKELVLQYGRLLPYPILLSTGEGPGRRINDAAAPWRQRFRSEAARREAFRLFGRETFDIDFFDAIPIASEAGDVEGIAFVLPQTPSPNAKGQHRVYLKNMLLTENAEGLLPDWAFFVRVVINANALRPNAAREALYEDATLEGARDSIGMAISSYLKEMAADEPERLARFIAIHHRAICALAAHDDVFFRLVADMLPFQTTMGVMTLKEYRESNAVVRYTATVDQFRQIASVAASQGMCIINAGHTYEAELLERLADIYPDTRVEQVDAESIAERFEELAEDERDGCFGLLRAADAALRRFGVAADMGKFEPEEMPTLYTSNRDQQFWRSAQQSREVSQDVLGDIVGGLAGEARASASARLMLNYRNPLVKRLCTLGSRGLLKRVVEMLYVQALLLGHYPLSSREMQLLNEGLMGMIELLVANEKENR